MAAYGIPEADISMVVGIDPKTLRKHYREELTPGRPKPTPKWQVSCSTQPATATSRRRSTAKDAGRLEGDAVRAPSHGGIGHVRRPRAFG